MWQRARPPEAKPWTGAGFRARGRLRNCRSIIRRSWGIPTAHVLEGTFTWADSGHRLPQSESRLAVMASVTVKMSHKILPEPFFHLWHVGYVFVWYLCAGWIIQFHAVATLQCALSGSTDIHMQVKASLFGLPVRGLKFFWQTLDDFI